MSQTVRSGEEWKTLLRAWALDLGFTAFRVAEAKEPPRSRSRLAEWISRDYHASMTWMARDPERRVDPAQILDGAQSVVVVAMRYRHSSPRAKEAGPRIAAYAQGADYHEVIGARLRALVDRLRAEAPEIRCRVACDTSPILEKAWAAQAGLGWLGKNVCLIDTEQGSWFFLGEIFTTLYLPPDEPAVDRCGSCRACLDACPTQAFPEPYLLDARRCISYLNIEHRGPLGESGAELGDWLVGCDICQEVCPWNRKAPDAEEESFRPRADLVDLCADDWAQQSDEEYRRRVRGTAVSRIKPADMRRNAAHVAANLRAIAARESLEARNAAGPAGVPAVEGEVGLPPTDPEVGQARGRE